MVLGKCLSPGTHGSGQVGKGLWHMVAEGMAGTRKKKNPQAHMQAGVQHKVGNGKGVGHAVCKACR